MSIEVLNLAFYVKGLTPTQKATLIALANYANPDGGHAFPSIERMALMTSYSERTIKRALKDLGDIGLITIAKESKRYSPTAYQLDLAQMKILQERPGSGVSESHPSAVSGVTETTAGVTLCHPSTYTRDLLTKEDPKIEDQGLEDKDQEEDYSYIPDQLQDPSFIKAWKDWEVHRKQIKHKLTPLTIERQLKQLSSVPLFVAIHMIEKSIENGWQGLFVPKDDDPIWQEAAESESDEEYDPWAMIKAAYPDKFNGEQSEK